MYYNQQPVVGSITERLYSYDVDELIEALAYRGILSRHIARNNILPSDIFINSSTKYRNINVLPTYGNTNYRFYHTYDQHQNPHYYRKCITPLPSLRPHTAIKNWTTLPTISTNPSLKRQLSIFGLDLPKITTHRSCDLCDYHRPRQSPKHDYSKDYTRLRFLELLTAIHRVYLEPQSRIHLALTDIIYFNLDLSEIILSHHDYKYFGTETIVKALKTIIDNITEFMPVTGILGTSSDESVLKYLLMCKFDDYPTNYFWIVEKRMLAVNDDTTRRIDGVIDHFKAKYLIISAFFFRSLIKTLLYKPVKYRLLRGTITKRQWNNIRLLSTLLLWCTRHAVDQTQTMPFPWEMQEFLFDDDKLLTFYSRKDIEQIVNQSSKRISAWACEYAERLRISITTKKQKNYQH
ncbi:unnamed protein product [Didymodactylos carnosus]|uniref:Uncharacterized protein n=1 Tax=Didymodactylos carnosus TaxID=1234261 RepID=A0A813P6Q8_9BILA|nr:unnamed protein product [Didymodactylos carnosus]CAF1134831.1 unnamed protein product [Didymodactylos carnosus]CAF3527542.1 unnamed protein product [Didymodactylos carnosus]CAF3922330.1 unnamed protein product [Didymodactylos carnosus]